MKEDFLTACTDPAITLQGENVRRETSPIPEGHSNIDHYEKQFGIIAIEKGFIRPEMLVEALKIQVEEEVEFHTHRLIGEILMEKDYITAMQIQEVLNLIFKNKP